MPAVLKKKRGSNVSIICAYFIVLNKLNYPRVEFPFVSTCHTGRVGEGDNAQEEEEEVKPPVDRPSGNISSAVTFFYNFPIKMGNREDVLYEFL